MNFLNSRRMVVGYISVLLLIVLVSVKGYAQGGEITWERPFEKIQQHEAIFIKKDPNTKYTYWLTTENNKGSRDGGQNYYVTVFDNNNIKIQSRQILFPKYNGTDVSSLPCSKVVLLKDKFFFIVQYKDNKKRQVEELIVQASLDGELTTSITNFTQFKSLKGRINFKDDLILSPDSTKLIANTQIPIQRGVFRARCIVNIYTIDNMKLASSGDYLLPEGYDFCSTNNYMVADRAQNIFLLALKITKTGHRRDSTNYTILKLTSGSEFTDELPLAGLSGKDPEDISLNVDRRDDITVSGFYKEYNSKLSYNCYNGVFMGAVKSGGPIQLTITEFTNEEKLNRTSPDHLWKVVNHVTKDDGGIILLSEQQFFDHSNQRYGNILIVDMDKDGNVVFTKTVKKDQVSLYALRSGDYYSYYHKYIQSTKKLFIVYNDNPRAAEQNYYANQMTPIGSVPVLEVIDSTGALTKSRIRLNEYTILCPSFTTAASDNEFIVQGKKGGVLKLGTLTINDTIKPIPHVSLPSDTATAKLCYGFRLSGSDIFARPKIFTGLNVVLVKSYLRRSCSRLVGEIKNS